MLNIVKYSEKLDWQTKGHHGNVNFGIKYVPSLKLLPFRITTSKALTVSNFEVRRVKPLERNIGIEVLQTIVLDTALLQQSVSVFNDNWYYLSTSDISGLGEGIWQFYIKFGNGDEYQSELMRVPCACEIIQCLPDFNNDFNNDFLICDEAPTSFALFNYGNLYNWYAVNSGKLVPSGYRVPSLADMNALYNYLVSKSQNILNVKSDREMPVNPAWTASSNTGLNTYDIHFLPNGTRNKLGSFASLNTVATFWVTNSYSTPLAWMVYLSNTSYPTQFIQGQNDKQAGGGIRPMRTATAFEQTLPDGTNIQTVFDADGNFYNAIKIGTQVWFNQNLKATKYNDGTDIDLVTDSSAWFAKSDGAYCTYNNDLLSDYEDSTFLYYE